MTIHRKNIDENEVRLDDGAATLRLRELENQTVVSRRGVLWRAGLATAAGAAALTALDQQQAQAATGGNFVLGQVNSAGNTSTLEAPAVTTGLSSILMTLDGTNTTQTTLLVKGTPGGNAINVPGVTGSVALRLTATGWATKPATGTYALGDVVSAADGLWLCIVAGSPGTWRKLGGPAAAGAFHAITPHRVYDSRHSSVLTGGHIRTVSVANGINSGGSVDAANLVPAGATAIAVNVTITSTVGGGSITVYPTGATQPLASSINWYASGQTLANGIQVAISASRQVNLFCSGTHSTNVILDVSGYYL